MILPMAGDEASGWKPGTPTVFLNTPFSEEGPMFSPDGRWIAYTSTESGQSDVYVQPFPGPGGKWLISTNGGNTPTWSRARRELFYATRDQRIMRVPFSVEGDAFHADKPQPAADAGLHSEAACHFRNGQVFRSASRRRTIRHGRHVESGCGAQAGQGGLRLQLLR